MKRIMRLLQIAQPYAYIGGDGKIEFTYSLHYAKWMNARHTASAEKG